MKRYLCIFMATMLVSGCGGSESKPAGSALSQANMAKVNRKPVTITGIIRNDKTLIKSAKLEVTNNADELVVTNRIKEAPRFSVEIPAGTTFPILLTVYPDADQPNKEILKVVIMTPETNDQIVTKVTTDVADKARELGGYTRENMMKAAMGTVATPDRDKTVGGFRGDPTKQYGGWH